MLTVDLSRMCGCEPAWLRNAVHSAHKSSYAIRAGTFLLTPSALGGHLLQKTLPLPSARPAPCTRDRCPVVTSKCVAKRMCRTRLGKGQKNVHGRHTDEILLNLKSCGVSAYMHGSSASPSECVRKSFWNHCRDGCTPDAPNISSLTGSNAVARWRPPPRSSSMQFRGWTCWGYS